MNTTDRPKLSLIIGARNDRYMGNFKYRFETTLNYLANNLNRLGRLTDVEVVITDWGSDVPLHRVLSLNQSARQIARFILVPPDIAYKLQGDSEFPIVLAQNVALRRSRAEFIAQTDSDVLLTEDFLGVLFEILDGKRNINVPVDKALILAKRRHVPWHYVSCNPDIYKLNWFIRSFRYLLILQKDITFSFAATGMMMMHRHLWEECRGYDERLIHWGWMEIELALRIMQKYPCFDLLNLGVEVFHLEHYPPSSRRIPARKHNLHIRNNSFFSNDEKWGVIDYAFEIFTPLETAGGHQKDMMSLTGLTYPSDIQAQDLMQNEKQRALRLSIMLVLSIVYVILNRSKTLRRLLSYNYYVWHNFSSNPVNQWPDLLKGMWIKYQRNRKMYKEKQ